MCSITSYLLHMIPVQNVVKSHTGTNVLYRYEIWHFVTVSCKRIQSCKWEPGWTRTGMKLVLVSCKHPLNCHKFCKNIYIYIYIYRILFIFSWQKQNLTHSAVWHALVRYCSCYSKIMQITGIYWTWPDLTCSAVRLHSSVGRASHRYYGGHGFKSCWSLRICSGFYL